eukprot:scaffold2363_cov159-Amphora_coffeaeformis.AAC.41
MKGGRIIILDRRTRTRHTWAFFWIFVSSHPMLYSAESSSSTEQGHSCRCTWPNHPLIVHMENGGEFILEEICAKMKH